MNKINASDYKYFGLWKCNPFAEFFWASWFNQDYLSRLGIPITQSGVLALAGGNFFVKNIVIEEASRLIEEKIQTKDLAFFEDFVSFADKIFNETIDRSNRAALTTSDADFITEVVNIGRDLMFIWFLGWLFGGILETHLKKAAEDNKIALDKILDYVSPIATPLADQREDLYILKKKLIEKKLWEALKKDSVKALEEIKNNCELKQPLSDHLKQYSWIQIINYLGNEIKIENLVDQMTHLESEDKNVVREIPDGFKFFSETASNISYLGQAGAQYSSIYMQIIVSRLKKIAASLNLAYRDMLDFMPEEINAIKSGQINVAAVLERRQNDNWCIYANEKSQTEIIDDRKIIDELIGKMIPLSQKDDQIINGQVGNKGYAKGRAKIIMANSEFNKLELGDVLVTTMTTPDFVILMQKSCAIVTDIGGLLCHAAIMSRELGKPCIIGTKHATKTLKDGDLVEVDANKGIVKVINP